eukprot:XP_786079.3 PREDICTED: uncharacterized protein LOC580961 [Strongylocentrotus purpuratus]
MTNISEWTNFDEDAAYNVNMLMHGTVEMKLSTYEKFVHAIAVQHFGAKDVHIHKEPYLNRRKRRLEELRKQRRDLRKRLRDAPDDQKEGLTVIGDQIHNEVLILTRKERSAKKRRERKRTRSRFMQDPFKTAKSLLEPVSKSELNCSKDELDRHLQQTYSATSNEEFEPWQDNIPPDLPSEPFDDALPAFQELKNVLHKTRNASSPGQNGIPYKMYKKCPRLLKIIWKLMLDVWRTKYIPVQWRVAEGVYIPKSATPNEKTITDFRPIALLNVEAKMFFAIPAKRLETYMRKNGYLDTTVQKGGVGGHPGVWEHVATLWEVIKDAKTSQKNLVAIWLDLANAFGSVPHAAIAFALKWYHLPESLVSLMNNYYVGLYARFSVKDWNSEWQKFSVGIFMGCTLSPILFVITFNLLNDFLKSTPAKQYHLKKRDFNVPVMKEYMDDITIITASVESAGSILSKVNDFMDWSKMRIKPVKSRSLVVHGGKVKHIEPFAVDGQTIPGVHNKPVKFLGRLIDGNLKDNVARQDMMVSLGRWLHTIDKCVLTGVMKCWIYQYLIVPRMQWKLMIYDVPVSQVEKMETLVSKKLRRWLGASKNLTNIALYCHQTKLRLQLEGLTTTMKKTVVNAALQLRHSKDNVVTSIRPQSRHGHKWDAEKAISRAEDSLRMEDIVRGQVGRRGLGAGQFRKPVRKLTQREVRTEISELVVKEHDNLNFVRAVQMPIQGAWSSWEGVQQKKLSWRNLFDTSPKLLQFMIGSTYDTVASPANLKRWGLSEDDACKFCQQKATTTHILAGCPIGLQQGRYTWRHNRVLGIIGDALKTRLSEHNQKPTQTQASFIHFVREGEATNVSGRRSTGRQRTCLDGASDWNIRIDLGEKLIFPPAIVVTNLRPDVVIWSPTSKRAILLELTVPHGANMQRAHERKSRKYEELLLEAEQNVQENGYHYDYLDNYNNNSNYHANCAHYKNFPANNPNDIQGAIIRNGYAVSIFSSIHRATEHSSE